MSKWEIQLIAGLAAVLGAFLLILVIKLCNLHHGKEQDRVPYMRHQDGNVNNGSSSSNVRQISMVSSFRKATVPVQPFEWKDHPKLMSEALENGWSAFALSSTGGFTVQHNRQQQQQQQQGAVTSWEVEVNSGTELMQVIKFNPGLPNGEVSMRSTQFMKSRLPLPGPLLGCYSYPQEAYFEVSILSVPRNSDVSKFLKKVLGIGLVSGPSCSFGDVGSIAYFSNGHVLLDGVMYTIGGEHFNRRPWLESSVSKEKNVVGCGFNPKLRKVFFTLNGDVTCQVNCSNCEEFGYPLHAAFMSNYEQTVVVNFGQCMFEFLPENCTRVSDPGNLRPPASSRFSFPRVQYDSGDLFSMGRPDDDFSPAFSQDLRPAPSEAESELFEIVLEADKAMSPNVDRRVEQV